LVIEPRDQKELEDTELYSEVINQLLIGFLSNYGKWKKSQLAYHPTARIIKIKHLSEWTVGDWAMVIYERLNINLE